jgi:hypothetical protein
MRSIGQKMICAGLVLGLVTSALATENTTLTFSKPTNIRDSEVTVEFDPGADVSVTIPPGKTAQEKRDLIKAALMAAGYDVTTEKAEGGPLPGNQLRLLYLRNGTEVTFDPGATGELKDDVVAAAVSYGSVDFVGLFEPFEYDGDVALFTAGFATDVGEVAVELSAEELEFRTDGGYICQRMWEMLARQAPAYGVEVVCEGERLSFYFDAAMTTEQGGVSFGTTSPTPGCSGGIILAGSPCPEDIDGDGIVGLSDLAELLASYGAVEGETSYNPAADIDQNGTIDLADLAALLAAYGSGC